MSFPLGISRKKKEKKYKEKKRESIYLVQLPSVGHNFYCVIYDVNILYIVILT